MKIKQRSLFRSAAAIVLATRQALFPKKRLPITELGPLFEALPADFRLTVADVGSIGGLHRRWRPLGRHLTTLNFDPLDKRRDSDEARVFPVLVGASKGQATLNVTKRGSMSSVLKPNRAFFAPFWNKPDDVEIEETLTAAQASLDELALAENAWPDALKIDVQGGEAMVLEGASEALSKTVLLAEIECSFAERYEGQETIDQIIQRMRAHGFALLDLRRLKRYCYRNPNQVDDASLGRGMRAGRLAFCDAIFCLEPELLWERVQAAGEDGGAIGLKAVILFLVYGKADLAAATFERARDKIVPETRDALESFFSSLTGRDAWRQQLHVDFDAWSQRV